MSPGSNEDRHRPSAEPSVPSHPATDDTLEDDNNSVESYNTAASSLSLGGNVCKICHCGEEVDIKIVNQEGSCAVLSFSKV